MAVRGSPLPGFIETIDIPTAMEHNSPKCSDQLPSTAPSSLSTATTSEVRKKQVKRTYSLDSVEDVDSDNTPTVVAKKPRGRRPKPAVAVFKVGKPHAGKRTNTMKTNAGKDPEGPENGTETKSIPPSFSDAETQTSDVDMPASSVTTTEHAASNCSTHSSNKSLADTVSEAMTTFIATVTANVNSLHSELKVLQEAVLQLMSSQSEVDDLRSAVQQMAEQHNMMKDLRDAVVSAHRIEVQQLRDIVQQQLSTQQRELEKFSEAISHIADNQSRRTINNQQQPSTLQWRATTHAEQSEEMDDSEFPPLPQPSRGITISSQSVSTKSASTRQYSRKSEDKLKQDVMVAMYADLKLKQNRENNIIISGLQSDNNNSDLSSIRNLIHDEFNWTFGELEASIVNSRRLGKQGQDKVQPILVTCDSKDTASYLISNAKRLRQSRTASVREHLYISADLTPAEAKAAYEMRCRRREQLRKNQENQENQNQEQQQDDMQQQQQQCATASRLIYRSRPRSATEQNTTANGSNDGTKNSNQSSSSSSSVPAIPTPQSFPPTDTSSGNSPDGASDGRHR